MPQIEVILAVFAPFQRPMEADGEEEGRRDHYLQALPNIDSMAELYEFGGEKLMSNKLKIPGAELLTA